MDNVLRFRPLSESDSVHRWGRAKKPAMFYSYLAYTLRLIRLYIIRCIYGGIGTTKPGNNLAKNFLPGFVGFAQHVTKMWRANPIWAQMPTCQVFCQVSGSSPSDNFGQIAFCQVLSGYLPGFNNLAKEPARFSAILNRSSKQPGKNDCHVFCHVIYCNEPARKISPLDIPLAARARSRSS